MEQTKSESDVCTMASNLTGVAEDAIRGGTSLLIGEMTFTLITGVASIAIARLLGPTDFALYGLTLLLPSMLFTFANLGVDKAMVRFIPKLCAEGKEAEAIGLLRIGLATRAGTAIVLSALGVLGADFFAMFILQRGFLGPYVRLSCTIVAFQALMWFSYHIFQAVDRMGWSSLIRGFQATSKALISIGLLLFGFGILGAILGFVMCYVLSAIGAMMLLLKVVHRRGTKIEVTWSKRSRVKRILGFGIPLYAVIVITDLSLQYRLLLLSMFTNELEIGNFSAVANISILLTGLSFALASALFPAFSKISSRDSIDHSVKAFSMGHRYVSIVVIPAAIVLIVLSKEIVLFLYGSQYELAPFFLSFFSISFLFIGLGNGVLDSYFNGMGENRLTLLFWLVYLAAFVPLSMFLTAQYGVMGLISAELISRPLSCIFGLWIGKRKLHIGIDVGKLTLVYLNAGLAGASVILSNLLLNGSNLVSLIVGLAVFLFVYATLLPLTGAITLSDLVLLEDAFAPMVAIRFIMQPLLQYERAILHLKSSNT